jgi:hypothetical protein
MISMSTYAEAPMKFCFWLLFAVFLVSLPTATFAWVRSSLGVEASVGSVTVNSKIARESDKTGRLVEGGLVGRWGYLNGHELGVGLGGVNYELSGQNKIKKFKQQYAANAGYMRVSYLLPLESDLSVMIGPEITGRYGKGAGFDFAMKSLPVASYGGLFSIRLDDEWGWNPGIEIRAAFDAQDRDRTVSFLSAGLSLVK